MGLSKTYGSTAAVDGVSLTVGQGRVYGVLGPNGSGKSTTVRMLLGLIRPDAGEVRLFGERLREQGHRLLSRVGAVVESPAFVPYLSGRDNLRLLTRYTPGPTESDIASILDRVHLIEAADRRFKNYSLGMKQRLGIAAAILHDPELIILDEPTNGLDPAGRDEMLTLVRRLSSDLGIAVIMSSHVLEDVVRTCDSVIVLREGRVAATRRLTAADAEHEVAVQVQVDGDVGRFVQAAAALGLQADRRDGWVLIDGPDAGAVLRGVRDAACTAEVGLRQLRRAGPTLEESLIGAIG